MERVRVKKRFEGRVVDLEVANRYRRRNRGGARGAIVLPPPQYL